MYNLSELSRRLECLILFATIIAVDHANKRLKVLIDEDQDTPEEQEPSAQHSGWLPWPAIIGNNYIAWQPQRVGTQVLIACPSGNVANGQIIAKLYSNQQPSPSAEPHLDIIQFNDGTKLEYNSESHTLTVIGVGNIKYSTPQKFTVNANEITLIANQHTIQGPVAQTGGDITSDGHGVQGHHHDNNGLYAPTSNAKP